MGLDLTGLGSLFTFATSVIDRVIPDPAQKLAAQQEVMKMAQDASLAQMANDTSLIKMQTDINAIEAASPSLFKSGWRPGLGWIGVIGLGYQWLIVPLTSYAYTLWTGHALPVVPPAMDPNLLMLIGSLLGVNIGARSVEKLKSVASS